MLFKHKARDHDLWVFIFDLLLWSIKKSGTTVGEWYVNLAFQHCLQECWGRSLCFLGFMVCLTYNKKWRRGRLRGTELSHWGLQSRAEDYGEARHAFEGRWWKMGANHSDASIWFHLTSASCCVFEVAGKTCWGDHNRGDKGWKKMLFRKMRTEEKNK